MKSILVTLLVLSSISAFAKVTATEAFSNLLSSGAFEGKNESGKCLVRVDIKNDSVVVAVETKNDYQAFALLDNASNYSVEETTGAIYSAQKLSFPRYDNGGTKHLSVRPTSDSIQFAVSQVLFDHHGNDASTYSTCTITK